MLRFLLSPLIRLHARLLAPRMVYGWRAADGAWRAHARVSTHTCIESPELLVMGDHVFIGHHNFVDASGGLTLGEGVQITNHCSVLTHSSHRALRLEREAYWGHPAPAGYERAATAIGDWSFVGPHSVIAPGSRVGAGVLVKAYSFVRGEVPDFAVVEGQPARVVGDVRELDRAWIERAQPAAFNAAQREAYEAWVLRVGAAPRASAAAARGQAQVAGAGADAPDAQWAP
ncbi:transferase family hexapeptide repeat protein [Rivibacter subsaxonicus]|uniref:Transferase family hexapeptide repeat protein n=2 Tax=Rivibacter subsaxonicus TaxID=457575 RepID=A0A4Q7VGR3_9BURK|nr:transferase family hexapeptide repeat protein [Rivibacter subsaxonicus]